MISKLENSQELQRNLEKLEISSKNKFNHFKPW